ncbi:MAG: carbohydrate kinase family protein [Thermotogaceae bacterium]|nr:carbohydrate kinase family protein [Thermotogaceae bacterium]
MKKVIVAGKFNVDAFYYVDRISINDNNVSKDIIVDLGGKAGNVSRALRRLGVDVVVTGCVGNDLEGEFLKKTLLDEGVDISHLKTCRGKTGRTAIVVTKDGENTMFNYPGVNEKFTPELIDWTLVEEGDALFIQFGIPADSIFELSSMVKRAGMMVYADTSFPSDVPWDAFPYIDYMSPNEREILQVSRKNDIEKAVKTFFKKGVEVLVVKMGEKGVKIFDGKNICEVPAIQTKVVDTTGAGDAFNAGFIYGRLKGLSDEDSAKLGVVLSSIVVERRGSSSAMPTLDEVKDRMKELGINIRI